MKAQLFAIVLSETIRELTTTSPLKGVPSGELYARVMEHMDVHTYDATITSLVNTKLVSRKNHFLSWIGPQFKEQQNG